MLLDASTVLAADDLTVELAASGAARRQPFGTGRRGRGIDGGNGSGNPPGPYALASSPTSAAPYACSAPPRELRQWSRFGYVPQRSMALLGGPR